MHTELGSSQVEVQRCTLSWAALRLTSSSSRGGGRGGQLVEEEEEEENEEAEEEEEVAGMRSDKI